MFFSSNPLQCSCLENPRDGGAWWATVHGVAQSGTRLKGLSSSFAAAFFYCYLYIYWLPRWFGGKESACQAGDSGSIPGSGRSPGEGNGNPLQYSCLENSTDRGGWRAIWGRKELAEQLSHHLPSPNSLRFAVQYTFLGY